MLDFCVKTRIRFSLRDKQLFEITEVEITKVDCICITHFWYQSVLCPLRFEEEGDGVICNVCRLFMVNFQGTVGS